MASSLVIQPIVMVPHSLSYSFCDPSLWTALPACRVGRPSLVNLICEFSQILPEVFSLVILGPVKLIDRWD